MSANWHYVTTKKTVQEIRGNENYLIFKQVNNIVDLRIVSTVFTYLKVCDLKPLIKVKKVFVDEVEKSIKKVGIKDPFVVHFITNVPDVFQHGLFVKSGNNRLDVCNRLAIEEVSCIVVNLTGDCIGKSCFCENYIEGDNLRVKEDVLKLFHIGKVRVTMRKGNILNAYVPKFLKTLSFYR